eukprot:g70748.t1
MQIIYKTYFVYFSQQSQQRNRKEKASQERNSQRNNQVQAWDTRFQKTKTYSGVVDFVFACFHFDSAFSAFCDPLYLLYRNLFLFGNFKITHVSRNRFYISIPSAGQYLLEQVGQFTRRNFRGVWAGHVKSRKIFVPGTKFENGKGWERTMSSNSKSAVTFHASTKELRANSKAIESVLLNEAKVVLDVTPVSSEENSVVALDEVRHSSKVISPVISETGQPIQFVPHIGSHAQYVRDMILGVNDGLVSMFLLIVGVVGGGMGSFEVLLTAITGALAGAISMGIGEFVATKSQREVSKGQMDLEKVHLKYFRQQEIEELEDILRSLSLEGELLERVVTHIGKNDAALMKMMCAFEFGMDPDEQRNPVKAMLASGGLFLTGSVPTWLPFCFTSDVSRALLVSSILSACALFAVGAVKTLSTRGNPLYSGTENLVLGCLGAGVSYGVGSKEIFDNLRVFERDPMRKFPNSQIDITYYWDIN